MARCGPTARRFPPKFPVENPVTKAAPERRVHLSERAGDAGGRVLPVERLASLRTLDFAQGGQPRRLSPHVSSSNVYFYFLAE
jgi:hypothetical protein